MGKGYPMWVGDTYSFSAIPESAKDKKKVDLTRSYRRECKSHEDETAFHTSAKQAFGKAGRDTFGKAYVHNNLAVETKKGDPKPHGTDT